MFLSKNESESVLLIDNLTNHNFTTIEAMEI